MGRLLVVLSHHQNRSGTLESLLRVRHSIGKLCNVEELLWCRCRRGVATCAPLTVRQPGEHKPGTGPLAGQGKAKRAKRPDTGRGGKSRGGRGRGRGRGRVRTRDPLDYDEEQSAPDPLASVSSGGGGGAKRQREVDPMDPSSYSDAPEGDWSTGREKAAGMVMVRPEEWLSPLHDCAAIPLS